MAIISFLVPFINEPFRDHNLLTTMGYSYSFISNYQQVFGSGWWNYEPEFSKNIKAIKDEIYIYNKRISCIASHAHKVLGQEGGINRQHSDSALGSFVRIESAGWARVVGSSHTTQGPHR